MHRNNAKSSAWIGILGAATATMLAAGPASAQGTTTEASGSASAQMGVGAATPTAAPMAAAPAPAPVAAPDVAPGGLDRDMWIGHFGIGWLGTRAVPIGTAAAGVPGAAIAALNTPIIGGRYWLNSNLGIDAGLGFFMMSGSNTAPNPAVPGADLTLDKQSQMSFVLHGGVPIALGLEGKHYSFQVTPELDIGFASGTNKPVPAVAPAVTPPDASLSGFMLQIGARAGAEIFFGFIGIPALSLEGSVGLYLATQSGSASRAAYTDAGVAVPAVNYKDSTLLIGTSALNNPWQIFTSNVAARYYF
jgi:hypothetical protein